MRVDDGQDPPVADGQGWLILDNLAYAPVAGYNTTILGKVVVVLRRT